MEYKLGHLPNGHSQHLLQVSQASVNGPSSLTKGPLGQTYPLTVFTPQKPEACLPQRDPSVFLQLPQRPQQGISQGEANRHYSVYPNVRTLCKTGHQPSLYNQVFKHIASTLPVKRIFFLISELRDFSRRKCSIPKGLV